MRTIIFGFLFLFYFTATLLIQKFLGDTINAAQATAFAMGFALFWAIENK